MRKLKFSDSKIVALLKEAETGRKVSDICKEHGIEIVYIQPVKQNQKAYI